MAFLDNAGKWKEDSVDMELRFGIVGGGLGGFIGKVHRQGAIIDDLAVLVCGCFSRNEEKNRATGRKWHIKDESRIYGDFREMAEAESKRGDGIDFVSIATPNNSHYEIARCFLEHGINVMCDKPLALNVEQGIKLKKLAEEKGLMFGLTYTFTGYAMIRQAREMIDHGEIGNILHVVAEFPQDWLIVAQSNDHSDQAVWRMEPEIAGKSLCTADIGTHLEQLIVQMTGLKVKRVLARFDTYPRTLPLETNTTVLMDFGDEISGTIWASQIALGYECGVRIRVFGTDGALEWSHDEPGVLKYTKLNEPTRVMRATRDYLYPESRRLSRLPSGHPEGFFEAFGNIYHSYCEQLQAKIEGRKAESYTYPTIDDGIQGLKFIDACVESNKNGNIWVDVE